jgi:hypothetical protein
VNSEYYITILEKTVIPWANKRYGAMNWVLVQDNAPCHVSKRTVSWMTPKMNFWPKGVWPPSSPDLNVLDYAVFACLQKEVNKKPYSSIALLLKSIKKAWSGLKEEWVKKMVSAFRHRVSEVIEAEGGHIR